MSMKVDQYSKAARDMQPDWDLIDALIGGTRTMRVAGQTYLPKRAIEEDTDYLVRLQQATLFPALAETVGVMVGRVFAEPLQFSEDVPQWIRDEVLPDVDRQGRNLHVFAREWFRSALAYGLSHVLVEAPRAAGIRTRADQRAAGVRPYLIQITPRRILGWREEGGTLTQLRVRFTRAEPDGAFGEREVEQVRVYEPGRVVVWEKGERDWVPVEEIATGFARIPLITLYTGRSGFLTATPPLRELAFLNAKHWAQQSSNDTLLDTASVPILSVIGVDDGDQIVIGAKHAVRLPANGRLEYVEHSGAAIGAGRTALTELKEEMRQAGAKLIAQQGATKTATQISEEAARENSALGAMVQDFEDTIDDLLDAIAETRGEAAGGSAKVQANLDPDIAPAETMQVLIQLRNAGVISDALLFAEAQRRGLISDEVAWADEQTRIAEQPGQMA
jgi:hypothetical protein